jgi:hypothetical protein
MALLVQSGGLVGMGVPAVAVADGRVAEVAVAAVSSAGGAVVSVAAGASVVETGAVVCGASVAVEAGGSVAAPPLQADRASVNKAITVNSFLIILGLLCHRIEPDLWNCGQLAFISKHHDLRF